MESQAKGSLEGNISANTAWKALDKLDFFTQFVNTSVYTNFSSAKDRVLLCKPEFLCQIVIGFLGILLNLLCMMALLQVRNKWTCHFRIMLSLMFADLLRAASDVTLVLFNAFVLYFTEVTHSFDILHCRHVIYGFLIMGMNATLLSLTCMAMDHYVTIMYPWRSPVSARKCCIMIITIWLIAAMAGFSDFFISVRVYKARYTILPIGLICIVVMMSLYLPV